MQRNIDLAEDLFKFGVFESTASLWRSDTISILDEVFGIEDELSKEIRKVEFNYSNIGKISNIGPTLAVKECIAILKKGIWRVEKFGIPKNKLVAHPLWYALVIPVLLFIISLFTTPMQKLLGINEDDLLSQAMIHNDSLIQVQQEKERLSKIEILKSDLQSWHEENNAKYTNALDSLNFDQASRGVYSSGIAVKQVIEFSKSFRMKRDNTIDSFFVRLEALGLNVNTLDIKKKLPINLSQYLKPRIEGYRLIRYYANMRLDTL